MPALNDSAVVDCISSGTHVAGTIGGTTYGVAKKVSLYAVKVLNASGSGTNSGVISGMNYVTTDSQSRSCPNGVVANMSLGGSKSTAVNTAAANMVSAGVFLAVAAGNDGANAASYSPASESTACTVGATTSADALASYSNFGALVDILAPGSNVLSSWIGSNSATNTISGTSMATPHITGLGAYYLALSGAKTPAALCAYVSTQNILKKSTRVQSNVFVRPTDPEHFHQEQDQRCSLQHQELPCLQQQPQRLNFLSRK